MIPKMTNSMKSIKLSDLKKWVSVLCIIYFVTNFGAVIEKKKTQNIKYFKYFLTIKKKKIDSIISIETIFSTAQSILFDSFLINRQ